MVEAGMKCIKYLLFAFNLIFFLVGIGLIAVGGYVQAQMKDLPGLSLGGASVSGPAIFLIVVGVIVFIIAFFGCCGAVKENYCMILTFSILLVVIFIFEISAGIAAYVLRDRVSTLVQEAPGFNNTACCIKLNSFDSTFTCGKPDEHGAYLNGTCTNAFVGYLQSHVYIVGAVGIAFAVIQTVGIVFACCLARAVRKEYEVA